MKDYCLYLPHFSNTYSIDLDKIIAAGFGVAELQSEFFETTRNKAGRVFADNTPPASYLERAGVEVWGYVSPFWLESQNQLGSLRDTGRDDDPYWFKRSLTRLVTEGGWWLRDRGGALTLAMGLRPVADITVDACRDAIVAALVEHPCRRLRFDNSMVHQDAYLKPAPRVSAGELLEAQMDVYRRVRAAGKVVVVNGGWEMADPEVTPYAWPLHEVVDGVMIEWPYRFWGWQLTLGALAFIAEAWVGKRVVLVAPYTTQGYKASKWPSYVEHARALASYADGLGWWFATGREDPGQSMTGRVWRPEEWRETTDDGPPTTVDLAGTVAAHELRIAALERQLRALEAQYAD